MAIWQFEVAFKPVRTQKMFVPLVIRRATTGSLTAYNRVIARPGFSDQVDRKQLERWAHVRRDRRLIRTIDGLLPRRKSWSSAMILWGHENGNRIHAVKGGGLIIELTARIDLRRDSTRFLNQLVQIADSLGSNFETADGSSIRADSRALLDAIRRSDEWRFCSDPEKFVEGLGVGDDRVGPPPVGEAAESGSKLP